MKSIKFANGAQLPIIECYNNGMRYIDGATRSCREIVLDSAVVGLDELKALLSNPANLSPVEVSVQELDENGGMVTNTELLENYICAGKINYDFGTGEVTFTIGQKTALELEHEEAIATIDELLIAMEV